MLEQNLNKKTENLRANVKPVKMRDMLFLDKNNENKYKCVIGAL